MRILDYTIGESEKGWSVEHFLKMRLQFGKKQISRLKFRQGGLILNGVQCRSTQILQEGDRLSVCLDEAGKQKRLPQEYVPDHLQVNRDRQDIQPQVSYEAKAQPQVLYEDEDVLAVYKPGGVPVHPSHGHARDTLWNMIISLQKMRGEKWTPRIIGRLDKDTSGVVLFAKTTEAAAALASQRERKLLRKLYIAEAEGILLEKQGCIDLAIEKDPSGLKRMRVTEEGLEARTYYRVLSEGEGTTFLELELEHGRTHQIRVHLASAGHPLVGDPIYNPAYRRSEEFWLQAEEMQLSELLQPESQQAEIQQEEQGNVNMQQTELHLHAGKLMFRSPFTGEVKEVSAPLPGWYTP